MKSKTIIIIVLAAIGVSVGIVACSKKAKQEQAVATITEIPVKLVSTATETITDPVTTSGFISSETEAHLSFKTGGVVQHIYVSEGQSVRKGQLLASLDLTEINSGVDQAKLALEKAQRDYDRAKNLYNDTVASLEEFQNATTGLDIAKRQYETARFNLSYSEIHAAQDGKIERKLVNEGEIVTPGATIFLINTAGAHDWLVKVGIADKDWARLKPGNTATIDIDAYPGEHFTGTVSELAQIPDALSGLYQVEIKLNNCKKTMATGLFAKVQIEPQMKTDYVSIPVDAVIEGNGNDAFVFTTLGDKAHKQPIKIAFLKDGKAMLTSGLAAGTEIITDGSAYLTDGALVKVMK